MNAHRELLTLHQAITKAHGDFIQYNWRTLGTNWSYPGIGVALAISGLVTAPYLTQEASTGILITAAVTVLGSPLPIYLVHRKKKTLKTAYQNAITNYTTALHGVLDSKGYKGEYLSENDPSNSEHHLLANKNGNIETITVKAMPNGMLITSKTSMLAAL